jgi:hypothetical protein
MPTEAELERIISSRQVLGIYERNGLPGGRIEDTLRMLSEEIAFLRGHIERYPETTESISALIRRWEGIRDRVKATAN